MVPYDSPWEEITSILENCHGLVMPGGASDIITDNPYSKRVYEIYKWIKNRNEEGCSFFIWAVCQGFEQMLINYDGNKKTVLDKGLMDHRTHKVTIKNEDDVWNVSPVFGNNHKITNDISIAFKNSNAFFYAHNYGLYHESF